LLTRKSWSHLRDTQGFGMQCVAYINQYIDSFSSRHNGALHRLLTSLFPDCHLLAWGYCPLGLGFCLVRRNFMSQFSLFSGPNCSACDRGQGCQIFLGALYQNWKKCTKWTQNVPNGHKISQISIKYSKWP
jgi:hypothetical protein